jgi:GxxExxY protein
MKKIELREGPLTHSIIGAFFEVYNTLGFGFFEHVYVMALERELIERNHRVAREVSVHVSYKEHVLAVQRIDMIVDDKVVVETKAGADLPNAAQRQLFNYLRATKLEVGLVLHFGLEPRFHRVLCSNKGSQSA